MNDIPAVHVVRGQPDDWEVAALVAGLAAASAPIADDTLPIPEWNNRVRVLRGTGAARTAQNFGGRYGRHHPDAWRWSFSS